MSRLSRRDNISQSLLHNHETPMDDLDSSAENPGERELLATRVEGVVLYVEDDTDTRDAMGILLRAAGLAVHEADSPESALARADSIGTDLDVLIVDYHLGDTMTGTELAEALARKLGHGVPTIILTGDPANAEMPWLRNSPVWLMRKPADPLTLISGLHPLIEFRRAMRRVATARTG